MSEEVFVAYVGDPDIHDGHIVQVEKKDKRVRVLVRGFSGRRFWVEFSGVESVKSSRPEGMMLYSLSEMKAPAPLRRFVFTNWDEDDDAFLEIVAQDFVISKWAGE
jgi:hypothetical protein